VTFCEVDAHCGTEDKPLNHKKAQTTERSVRVILAFVCEYAHGEWVIAFQDGLYMWTDKEWLTPPILPSVTRLSTVETPIFADFDGVGHLSLKGARRMCRRKGSEDAVRAKQSAWVPQKTWLDRHHGGCKARRSVLRKRGLARMFGILKKKKNKPLIGVDLSGDCLTMAQLANGDQDTTLVAGSQASRPKDVVPGSVRWQKWAIDAMRCATDKGHFHGKDVIAALPAGEIFVDHIKYPKHQQGKLEEAVFSQIKRKLPFEPILKNALIKCIPTEQDNVMVLATERAIVERHLAIYEHAGLAIKSIGVWPVALATCHTGERRTSRRSSWRWISSPIVPTLSSVAARIRSSPTRFRWALHSSRMRTPWAG
jgi:hypothetical protein